MTDIYKWSKTAADNDDADSGINWAEFQDPDTVNNSARTMMKRVADWRDDMMPTRTSAGSGNSYTVSANAAPTSFSADFVVWFKADKTNTGSATLTVNALSAKPLRAKSGTALTSGDIQTGTIIGAYYSVASDEFLIINSGYHFTALSSTIARWSATPETRACTSAPPSSSAVTSSPVAAFTSGGPPRKIVPVPLTITVSSLMAGT